MIYGVISHKQELILEDRTSFFINYAGSVIQNELHIEKYGVSTRKLYKVLANVIIDWHWLSKINFQEYNFSGAGELVWIPHRFGGIQQIVPSVAYTGIKKSHELFVNILDLIGFPEYSKYGIRGVIENNGQRHILFPTSISYKLMKKTRVEDNERYHWGNLIKIYSKLPDSTLDSLASCRTITLCLQCLWIQFVMWKYYLNSLLTSIINNDDPFSENNKSKIKYFYSSSSACIKQLFVKLNYYNNINSSIEELQEISKNTEYQRNIPCNFELNSMQFNKANLEIFQACTSILESLHEICTQFINLNHIMNDYEEVDFTLLEDSLDIMINKTQLSSTLFDINQWITIFLGKDNEKEIAIKLLTLINIIFNHFENKLGLQFNPPNLHYKSFLENQYPLPKLHFIDGN